MSEKSFPSPGPGAPVPAGSLRADARRNRARVLEEAYKLFATMGLSVPMDEIAARAGVGVGTLYRNFPTKDALFEAVIVSRIQRLVDEAKSLSASGDPGGAFFGFLAHLITEATTNKAIVDALTATGCADAEITMELRSAVGELLTRAQEAGAVRVDVGAADLLRLLGGILKTWAGNAGDDGSPRLMLSIVCDGLRQGVKQQERNPYWPGH